MAHTPHLDVLQAAVVALAAALRPDQAAVARSVLLAGVADLEGRPAFAEADAAAAGALAELLDVLALVGCYGTEIRRCSPVSDGVR